MKIYIRAFAEKQKEIERSLSEKTDMIITHLLYIVMEPNSTTVNHWCNEIFAFIPKVDVLKGKNKYPSAKQIYSWTYGKKQDTIVGGLSQVERKIQNAVYKEKFTGTYDVDTITERLDTVCKKYFSWLADELSTYGIVAVTDVRKTINQIINEL